MRDMIERISLVFALASAPLLVSAQTPSTDSDAPLTEPVQTEQAAPAESDAEAAPAMEEAEAAPATEDAEAAPATEEAEAAPATEDAEAAPATEEAEAAPAPVEGQITLQSEDSILANDLIGQTVYSSSDESVGDINNIIIKFDGTVEGVVIGVGGFLGIGEKEVAVELGKIDFTTREGGGTRLILNVAREDLEAAPAFKTAREQRRDAESEEMQQQLENGVAPAAGN